MNALDILIPTYNRPAALAVTLTSLAAQTWTDFRIVISDQSAAPELEQAGEFAAILQVLRAHGNPVEIHRNLPRQGLAEQRQFLLDQVRAPWALFLDDDLILEPWQIETMVRALREQGCGFIGSAVIGLDFLEDVRPHEQQVEFWEGPVEPEVVRPDTAAWERYRLHNAANLFHLQRKLHVTPDHPRIYKVAWVGGCVLYDVSRLLAVGGFEFWKELPAEHCGEDVLAQLRVMARYGGCGLMPSGVYHQNLPTTVPNRQVDAPKVLEVMPKRRPSEPGVVAGVKKIAALRCNGLGDFIFALPALHALKKTYPAAELVLLGRPWHLEFLQGRPGPVDRVVAVPPCRGVGQAEDYSEDGEELEAFFTKMQGEHFDLTLQMHGGGRYSNPFVRRLGSRLAVGCRSPEADPLDRSMPYMLYQPEVLRYLELVSLVGATPIDLQPHVAVTLADRAEAAPFLPSDGKPLVVFHPGAGDPRRRWPPARFIATGKALVDAGARVAVVGAGDEECRLAETICAGLAGKAVDLCEKLTLKGLTGLLAHAHLLVSNDSGPLHLAAAVGTPTLGIYWCGNLITAGPLTRTFHRPAVSWRLNCPVCGQDSTIYRCRHSDSFVADVDEKEVIPSALELLNLSLQRSRPPSFTVRNTGEGVE